MNRLSKQQKTDVAAAVDACGVASDVLDKAITVFNEAMGPHKAAIEEAVSVYNEKVQALKEVYAEIAGEARDYYEDRSEGWQEGEKGQAYSEWIEAMEEIDLTEVEMEMPEDLELPSEIPDFSSPDFLPADEP